MARPRKTKDLQSPHPRLDDLAGQARLKAALRRLIRATRDGLQPLDHILLLGPDGTGKAAFAGAIANEAALTLVAPSPAVLDDPVALLDVMVHMRLGCILFVDRVDKLSSKSREVVRDCIAKPAPEALVPRRDRPSSHKIKLLPCPIIATALTLPPKWRDLEGRLHTLVIDPYTAGELAEIVRRAAVDAGLKIEPRAAGLIAFYAEGSPGRALTIFRRMCKRMEPAIGGTIRLEAARKALRVIGYG